MKVLRQIAERRMVDRVRNVESSEMEKSFGRDGSREISKESV